MQLLRRVIHNPFLNLAVGVLLVVMSGDEALASVTDGLGTEDLNAHLGVTLMGLLHALKALPELLEGLEYIERTEG